MERVTCDVCHSEVKDAPPKSASDGAVDVTIDKVKLTVRLLLGRKGAGGLSAFVDVDLCRDCRWRAVREAFEA